ncbi:uncharacterized protein BDV14DRAFT_193949 [Aspergillus stella-maris]|uniref:uncharacterized protein n=1 Tax=Aspergillus stella-maris TaxID=1810926 RepID=UPI003CCCCC1A
MAEKRRRGKSILRYNFLIIAFATFGSIAYGYSLAIIGLTLGQPSFLSYFNLDTASNSAALQGAINTIIIRTIFATIKGVLQAGSMHIAIGLVILVPLWQSKVAPPHSHGLLVGLHGVSILFGYSLSAWVGYGFYFVDVASAQWRPPLALQCFPPLILGIGILWIPESPRWLATLERIYHNPSNPSSNNTKREFNLICTQLEAERGLTSSWSSLLTVPYYRRRTLIGFITLLAGQLTGTSVINNYGPTLYKSLGHNDAASLALSAGWLTEGIICNIFNAFLLDYVGRKWLMTSGLVGCAVSLLGAATMVALYGGTSNQTGLSVGVFFLYLHLTFYATCMDASTYVFASEIWPTHLRAKGFAVSCAGLFVRSLTLLEAAPTAFDTIGY